MSQPLSFFSFFFQCEMREEAVGQTKEVGDRQRGSKKRFAQAEK